MTRRDFMKMAVVSASSLSLGLHLGCNGGGDGANEPIEFAILSDVHLYDSRLGTTGSAFEAYLATDPKLLRESEAILKSAIDSIRNSTARFVLVAGDMTKDGERDCHELMTSYLAQLKAAGKMVYVVPGNHDVSNPAAYSYSGSTKTPVPNVTAAEFASIYNEYGYNTAIARDPASLSYVAEPVYGYWLIAMDSCIYNDTTARPFTAGEFSDATLAWIRARLAEARRNNKIVLGLVHHALTEHFTGQATLFPGFVINNWANVSKVLAQDGMRFVFTGHFHATDATHRSWTDMGEQLYDIETGSLASYPCPYRQVSIEDEVMNIGTTRVTGINYDTGAKSFQQYALDYAQTNLLTMFVDMLMSPPHNLSLAQARQYAPLYVNAFVAHYAGDETPDDSTRAILQALLASSAPTDVQLGQLLSSLWADLPPSDNSLAISIYE